MTGLVYPREPSLDPASLRVDDDDLDDDFENDDEDDEEDDEDESDGDEPETWQVTPGSRSGAGELTRTPASHLA
jgi:hypothetical protein